MVILLNDWSGKILVLRYGVKVRDTLLVCGTLTIVMAGSHVVSPLYPLYQARFALGTTAVTLIASVFGVALIPTMLAAGPLSDRYGRPPVVWAGLAIVLLGDLAFTAAPGFGWLLAGRLLQGVGIGAFFGPGTALASDLSTGRRADVAPLAAAVASMVGLGLGPLGSGLLVHAGLAPLVLPFALHAALLVGGGAMLWAALHRPGRRTAAAHGATVRGRDQPVTRGRVVATGFAAWAIGGLLMSLLPLILAPLLGRASSLVGGAAVFGLTAAGAAGQFLAYRWPPARALMLGGMLEALAFWLLVLALAFDVVPLVVAATALCGLGLTAVQRGGFGLLILCSVPERKGAAISLFLASGFFAGNVLVLAFGVLADHFGLTVALRAHAALFGSLLLVLSASFLGRLPLASTARPS